MITVAVFVCIGMEGCGVYISPRNLVDQLPDRSSAIISGRMDSESVRNTLGDPRIASRYWGVEVFREATSQTQVPFIMIPFGVIKDDIYRYTLVSYDIDKVAEFVATGLHRRATQQWSGGGRAYKWENPTLYLQAGDFTFIMGVQDGFETLLLAPARRDIYLQLAQSPTQCTAVVGCGSHNACSSTLSVNNGPPLRIPFRIIGFDSIAALSLMPGEHILKALEGRWEHGEYPSLPISGQQTINFTCQAGEVLYVVIHVSVKEHSVWWGASGIEWSIDLHKDMPEFFVDRHLLLFRGDQWFVNPEQRISLTRSVE